jgi:hypothetical protein
MQTLVFQAFAAYKKPEKKMPFAINKTPRARPHLSENLAF